MPFDTRAATDDLRGILYVSVRLRARLNGRRRLLDRTVIKVCLTIGRPLPHTFRSPYLLGIYYTALRHYAPTPFRGRAFYIKSQARSSEYGTQWRRLMDGLDLHEILGSDHQTIVEEPYLAAWMEHLRAGLLAAQGVAADAEPCGPRPTTPETTTV